MAYSARCGARRLPIRASSADGNAARFDYDRSGVVFGADWTFDDEGLFGIAVNYRDMDACEDGRFSHGDALDCSPISTNSIALEAGMRLAVTDHLNLTAAYHGESGDSDHSRGVNMRLAFSY